MADQPKYRKEFQTISKGERAGLSVLCLLCLYASQTCAERSLACVEPILIDAGGLMASKADGELAMIEVPMETSFQFCD